MKTVYIVAGGTGGHINAALSLGEVFSDKWMVKFLSGTRYLDYQLFKNSEVTHLESKPLRTKNPFVFAKNITLNLFVFLRIMMKFLLNRPKFVIGAGGYICGPTLLAAKLLFIPIFIVEQNAVAGVTNKILNKFSDLTFTNFKDTKGIIRTSKVIPVGNPVRKSIRESKNSIDEEIKVLVFGGSLGATQINDAVQDLVKSGFSKKITIKHQVGKDNISELKLLGENIRYQQTEYIDDMQDAYDWANIIISRAGASTVSELRIIKKPTIIIPFPKATDNHQYHNALELKEENGFYVSVLDHQLVGKELAKEIEVELHKIIGEELYYRNEVKIINASELIREKVLSYVRNQ